MRILSNLIKIRLQSFFGGMSKAIGKKRKIGIVGIAAIYLLLILSFGMMFATMWGSLAMAFIPLGLDAAYFTFVNLIIFSAVFILSIFETKSELFECKDNETLLGLPIRPRDIILSRSISIIIVNIGISLIANVPAIILYIFFGGSAWFIPTILLVTLLVTLLATALSAVVGYVVAAISARLNHNSLVTIGVSLLLLGAYLFLYPMLMEFIISLEMVDGAAENLAISLGPLSFIGEGSIANPLYLLITIVICATFTLLVWFILSKNYTRIITSRVNGKTKKYVKKSLSSASPRAALIKKEMSALLSMPTYILNGAIGLIFQLLMAFALISMGPSLNEILPLLGFVPSGGELPLAVGALLFAMTSTNSLSASALSVEGKNYWILKTSPISASDIIIAKLAPHVILSCAFSLVSSVISAVAIGAEPLWWIYIILLPIVGSVVFAMLGLILNIVWPKLEFEHIAQVVKQSLPVFLMTFGGMLICVLMVLAAIALSVWVGAVAGAFIMLALSVVLFIIFYLILFGPSLRKLEKI